MNGQVRNRYRHRLHENRRWKTRASLKFQGRTKLILNCLLMNKRWLLAAASFLMAFAPLAKDKVTIYMIGDSTMAIKRTTAYPETGWGMPFVYFWDSLTVVDNRAQNGRSTRSFREEGLWASVQKTLKAGDYVIIEFGHNDEVPTKKSATTPAEFETNLRNYVNETRAAKANPILMTPVARRSFDSSGVLKGTHDQYSGIVRKVAADMKVPLVDMDLRSQELLRRLGPETSKLLYNQLEKGEHPNYPNGVTDNTHFSELGARKMAELALQGIRELNLPLAQHIYQPAVKK